MRKQAVFDGRRIRAAAGFVVIIGVTGVGQAASADEIKLSTGETLSGQVLSVTDETVKFQHPILGEMTLPRAMVTILPPPPEPGSPAAKAAAAAELAEAKERVKREEEAGPPAPVKEWKFKLTLAAAMTSGNTETGSGTFLFNATRETKETKLALDTGYFFAQNDGDRSENRFTAGGRNDWLNPGEKWFWFVDGRYDWDEFQTWDSRLNAHIGAGWKLFEPPKFKLNTIGGFGFVKEFGSPNDDVRPEALLGVEGQYDFAEKNALTFASTYYPDLADVGEYRWTNNVGWSCLMDQSLNLSLTAGVQHEYQSQVSAGREHNDFRLFAGVAAEF